MGPAMHLGKRESLKLGKEAVARVAKGERGGMGLVSQLGIRDRSALFGEVVSEAWGS